MVCKKHYIIVKIYYIKFHITYIIVFFVDGIGLRFVAASHPGRCAAHASVFTVVRTGSVAAIRRDFPTEIMMPHDRSSQRR